MWSDAYRWVRFCKCGRRAVRREDVTIWSRSRITLVCNARRLASFARVYSLTDASVFSSEPAGKSSGQAAHAAANSSSRERSMAVYR
jgi:hypothetical protein